jgi:hypothetical protein
MIDLATLTGACKVALGNDTAGLFSNCDDFSELSISYSDKSSQLENKPAVSFPKATLHAPVRVARSIIVFGLNSYWNPKTPILDYLIII